MAGNKNPWRDIVSAAEWQTIVMNAAQAKVMRLRSTGVAPPPAPRRGLQIGLSRQTPATKLVFLTASITAYGAMAKDDSALFAQRAAKLRDITAKAQDYITALGQGLHAGTKTADGKQSTDALDVWVSSIGRRAAKKAAYLDTMGQWHVTAKAKYKDRAALSVYLRGLAGDNTKMAARSCTLCRTRPSKNLTRCTGRHSPCWMIWTLTRMKA